MPTPFCRASSVVSLLLLLGLPGCRGLQPAAAALEALPLAAEIPERLPDTVQPSHYDVAWHLVPDSDTLTGEVRITLALAAPTQIIWLHGEDLTVAPVQVLRADGRRMLGHYRQVSPQGMAQIILPEALPAGTAHLTFRYSAPIGEQKLDGIYRVREAGEAYLFSQFEPTSARRALPCFDEPRFKAPLALSVRLPEALQAVANGPQVAEQRGNDGSQTKLITFAPTPPLPTYLFAVAVGPLDIVPAPPVPSHPFRAEPLPLRGVATRGHGPQLKQALVATAQILAVMERYLQLPFPFPKLDIVAVPNFAAGAMENAGLITFRDWMLWYDAEHSSAQEKVVFAEVMAHELAHHWFGNSVTMPWWDDTWLNESFATWMGHRTADAWQPTLGAELGLRSERDQAMAADAVPSARQIRQPVANEADIRNAFDGITYAKGAAVLHMVEASLGAEPWRKLLQSYLEAHQGGSADAAAFLAHVRDQAGPGWSAVLRDFTQQPGLPELEVAVQCAAAGAAPGTAPAQLHVRQRRYRPVGVSADAAAMQAARWTLPICWRLADGAGRLQRQCMSLSAAEQTVPLDVCPQWLMPNAEGTGYWRWRADAAFQGALARAPLTAAERDAWLDSLVAGMRGGSLSPRLALPWLQPYLGAGDRIALARTQDLFAQLLDEVLPAGQQPRLRRWLQQQLQPRLVELGQDPRPGETSQATLMRPQVVRMAARLARDRATQASLARAGQRWLGYGGDGLVHADALAPDLIPLALAAAAEAEGPPFVVALLARLQGPLTPPERRQVVAGLGQLTVPTAAAAVRAAILARQLRPQEILAVLARQGLESGLRLELWAWLQAHLDTLQQLLPDKAQDHLPAIVGRFCGAVPATAVAATFTPWVARVPGAARVLAQAQESDAICAAQVALLRAEATAFVMQLP